jgi:hypothetical protein
LAPLSHRDDDAAVLVAVSAGGSEAASDETCSATTWHTARENDTPTLLGKKLGVRVSDIVFLNRRLIPGLAAGARLRSGTRLRVPVKPPPVEEIEGPEAEGGGPAPVYIAKVRVWVKIMGLIMMRAD